VVAMKRVRTYQVKDVARIAGVSVRALHHYDEIGLLVPTARTEGGYRLYDDDDLLRLQQILIGRELGLSLEEIRRSLDDPSFDRKMALLKQRRLLLQRSHKTQEMIGAIDKALALLNDDGRKKTMCMKEIFDGFDPSSYENEVVARWGSTDAYRESKRRMSTYTAEDWQKLKAEQDDVYKATAAAMLKGRSPTDETVLDIADRHRRFIDRWFYPCSPQMHCCLAEMYETDHRFAENIDKYGKGLTSFLVSAIRANADRKHD